MKYNIHSAVFFVYTLLHHILTFRAQACKFQIVGQYNKVLVVVSPQLYKLIAIWHMTVKYFFTHIASDMIMVACVAVIMLHLVAGVNI